MKALLGSPSMSVEILNGLKTWFGEYLNWMNTHPYGIEERDYKNNHAICRYVQALAFEGFVGERDITDFNNECIDS